MLTGTNLRDPVLINTLGHTAGVLLFGFIIVLLIRDRRAYGSRQARLSIVAAVLALAWNVGSLIALASHDPSSMPIGLVMTASFSVLSLLPAVLLQVALKGEQWPIINAGYAVSVIAVLLHVSELFVASVVPHQLALILIAAGFTLLTVVAFLIRQRRGSAGSKETNELFSLAALLLFTISFPHFGYQHFDSPWAAEIAWHHIGIPVALIVLLQDYRFLLLDTFVRFLMNSGLATAYVAFILLLNQRFQIWKLIASSMFLTGLALVALCLSLILFAHIRNILQQWIGRVIFRRQNLDDRIRSITQLSLKAASEDELLSDSAREVAAHLRTDQSAVVATLAAVRQADRPAVLFGGQQIPHLPAELLWAEAQIPLRFSSGELRFLLTGSRRGRQRYLSEDLEDMRRLGSVIVELVERFRSEELKHLATQAELRALQAQINPHFLFNALNTLYGSIDRSSHEARRLVLNLADIFRYFLQGDRTFIALSEELRIVQAYLEIEVLRLGDRLETRLEISESARSAMIPILSIQPLVENAVKHGIAGRQGRGRITLRAQTAEGGLRVTVEDTGLGFEASKKLSREGMGVGLDNVRRRLKLSYGSDTTLDICSSESGSTVSFVIPSSAERDVVKHEIVVVA